MNDIHIHVRPLSRQNPPSRSTHRSLRVACMTMGEFVKDGNIFSPLPELFLVPRIISLTLLSMLISGSCFPNNLDVFRISRRRSHAITLNKDLMVLFVNSSTDIQIAGICATADTDFFDIFNRRLTQKRSTYCVSI